MPNRNVDPWKEARDISREMKRRDKRKANGLEEIRNLIDQSNTEASPVIECDHTILPEEVNDQELIIEKQAMSGPANNIRMPGEPTSFQPSVPSMFQPLVPPIPDPAAQVFRPKQRVDDRSLQPKTEQSPCPVPPVPLTQEQLEIYSWIFLSERYEAIRACRLSNRIGLFNQCATLAISILGIVGGSLAIVNGVRSATGQNQNRY